MIPSKTFCTTIITHYHQIKLTNLFVHLFTYLSFTYNISSQFTILSCKILFCIYVNPIVISRLRGPICHSFEWFRRPFKSETTTCRYQMQMIQRYEGNHLSIAGLPTCNAYVTRYDIFGNENDKLKPFF